VLAGLGPLSRYMRKSMMPRCAKSLVWTLASLLVAGCGADSKSPSKQTPSESSEGTAIARAYGALTAGAQDEVTSVIADVDDAVVKDPSDGRAVFYSAIMRFWQLGEEIDLPTNPADALQVTQTTIDRFREAQSLLPNDDRAPAFGGLGK